MNINLFNLAFISFFGLFLFSNSPANCQEIVVNKLGQKILLKNDGTWEAIKETDIQKIVIRITGYENHFSTIQTTDSLNEKIWRSSFGCKYRMDAKNPFNYPVKIIAFKYSVGTFSESYFYFNSVVKPNSRGEEINYPIIAKLIDTKNRLNDDEIKKNISDFGCETQLKSGKAILSPRNEILFPTESGIDKKDSYRFVTTDENGVVPLFNDFPQ